MAKEPFRGRPIAPCLHQDIYNLAVLIDCSPQIMDGPIDSDEHFVDMPATAHTPPVLPQLSGVLGSEFVTPQPDRLIAGRYPS
jgi:hypothetical protein